ncbi:MAG: hypothetical protein WC389_16160 [Lutibacter sp.]|jgi:DNA replication protein DnaC
MSRIQVNLADEFTDEYFVERWAIRAKELEPRYKLENKELVINLIRHYFNMKSCKYDVCKPFGLLGRTGVGKTFMFKMLGKLYSSFPIKYVRADGKRTSEMRYDYLVSAFTIFGEYSSGGYDGIANYINRPFMVIDDLGSEPTMANYFGNQVNVMKLIFEERHLKGNVTNFSSNLPMSAIKEKYGERVHDRIYQDTNIIEVSGTNWRLT